MFVDTIRFPSALQTLRSTPRLRFNNPKLRPLTRYGSPALSQHGGEEVQRPSPLTRQRL